MPVISEVVNKILGVAGAAEAAAQDEAAHLIAMYWFLYGGVSDADGAVWAEQARPVLSATRRASAERGYMTTSILYAFENDQPLPASSHGIFETPGFKALEARADKYIDAPVVRARYELSDRVDAVMHMEPPSAIVEQARKQVESMGLYKVQPSADANRYAAAMDRGAARAVQQALGDSDRAYGIGAGKAAEGKKVKRWLKVPHAKACERCILVSRRGYRTAETAKLAGHTGCRCSARAEWVKSTGRGSRERVRDVDWQEALNARGYGLLDQFAGADLAGRQAILQELLL